MKKNIKLSTLHRQVLEERQLNEVKGQGTMTVAFAVVRMKDVEARIRSIMAQPMQMEGKGRQVEEGCLLRRW